MASINKIAANRANACKSTGPKSESGKRRASKNARRHGLSIPIVADPTWSGQIVSLANKIAGKNALPVSLEIAKLVAAAQLDVMRVRSARQQLLSCTLKCGELSPVEFGRVRMDDQLSKLDRYERRALSRRRRAIRMFDKANVAHALARSLSCYLVALPG